MRLKARDKTKQIILIGVSQSRAKIPMQFPFDRNAPLRFSPSFRIFDPHCIYARINARAYASVIRSEGSETADNTDGGGVDFLSQDSHVRSHVATWTFKRSQSLTFPDKWSTAINPFYKGRSYLRYTLYTRACTCRVQALSFSFPPSLPPSLSSTD